MTIDRETSIRLAEEANCGWTNTGTEPMLLGEAQLHKFAALVLDHGRKPLTDEAILDEFCVTAGIHQFITAFRIGARFAERYHGITNKGSNDDE